MQALKDNTQNLKNVIITGTRKRLLNTKIEPNFEGSKKSNVEDVTILEPNDKEILPQEELPDNIYQRIVHVMKQSTQEYYNMRMVLGLKCI